MKGKEVADLLNTQLQSGDHQLNIRTNNISPGVYIIKIITTDGIETKKLVVE